MSAWPLRPTRRLIVLRHADCGGELEHRAGKHEGERVCRRCRVVVDVGLAEPQIGGRRVSAARQETWEGSA